MYPSQREFLRHILDECNFLIDKTSGKSFDELTNDEILSKAVVRSLEVIDEASKRVNDELKARSPEIPWRKITAMRNRLIHDYFGVDYEIVYTTLNEDIPGLKDSIEQLLNH